MRLTVKGQRADTEVNGSLIPTYGMQTREKALEKNREEKDSNLYPDAISANVLRIRRDRESDGMERNARPHPEQIPLPEPSSVTRPVCDRPENSCGIPIIDIRSIHSSPYKAYFAKKQSVHTVFISYIYK